MQKRKIVVVTSARSEYGLLYWVMREIQDDPMLELQVLVTGMHLSHEFGYTYQDIEKDGLPITEKVEMLLSSDSAVGVAKSMGLTVIGCADALQRMQPDIVVVLGDRYETLGVVQTAMLLKIPIAHIHGGEACEGCLDDAIRHAITKLSHIHFPVTEKYKSRILQMGENPEFVFNFGAPGLDHVRRSQLLSPTELETQLDIQMSGTNLLVTYHPVSINKREPIKGLYALFAALRQFPDCNIFFTKSSADESGRQIGYLIDEFVAEDPAKRKSFVVLGLIKYLSLAMHADAVIGNSSSALIEVPFVKTASVNIGMRQRGRLQASSVVNAEEHADAIKAAIEKALAPSFQASLKNCVSPYGDGDASRKIKDTLKTIDLTDIYAKKFFEFNEEAVV